MPIILDSFNDNLRTIVFEISSVGTEVLTLTANNSLNYLISASQPFSLQRPYQILETRFEKKINSLLISDGTNFVNYSSSIEQEEDAISILPDFATSLSSKLWKKIKKIKLEPSELLVSTRIKSEKLSALGISANPTISWNIDFQVSFIFS